MFTVEKKRSEETKVHNREKPFSLVMGARTKCNVEMVQPSRAASTVD